MKLWYQEEKEKGKKGEEKNYRNKSKHIIN